VLPEVRAAEMAVLLRRPYEEAEGHLLSANPPLVYRAVKLAIRAGRWARALEIAQSARAHVDTVLAYRLRALGGARETLPTLAAAATVQPPSLADWPAVKARKDAEKAAEARRPGAAPLPAVAAIAWRDAAASARGETNAWE